MALVYAALSLLPFAAVLDASPLEVRQANPKPTTTTICNMPHWTEAPCRPGAGPWAKPTECTNDWTIKSIVDLINNPPPEATSTYTPTKFCSDQLRQTDQVIPLVYSTGLTYWTRSMFSYTMTTKTVTDTVNTVATSLCPKVKPTAECDWDSEKKFKDEELEWHFLGDEPEACEQMCLKNPQCGSYHLDAFYFHGKEVQEWQCYLYRRPIDDKWKSDRVGESSKPAFLYGWWDRSCAANAPRGCNLGSLAQPTPFVAAAAKPRAPVITPAPQLPASEQDIEKRDAPFPPYLSTSLGELASFYYLDAACSCVVSSVLPNVLQTGQTSTVWNYTGIGTHTVTINGGRSTRTTTARATTTFITVE